MTCADHEEMVSPGFRLQPSLSDAELQSAGLPSRVSPRFRLRPSLSGRLSPADIRQGDVVSPGFRLRPSLSVPTKALMLWVLEGVSPGFRLRPSLSGLPAVDSRSGVPRVAGVSTPAFVERPSALSPPSRQAARTPAAPHHRRLRAPRRRTPR